MLQAISLLLILCGASLACSAQTHGDRPEPPSAPALAPAPPSTPASPPPETAPELAPRAPEAAPPAPKLTGNAGPFRFSIANARLVVADDRGKTVLAEPKFVTSLESVTPSADGRGYKVSYRDEISCSGSEQRLEIELQADALRARIENAIGMSAHRAARYEQAEAAFARALELDTTFTTARTNLACALSRQGRTREAVVVLAPLARDNPVLVYSKVLMDEDLKSLRAAPEILALKAKAKASAPPLSVELLGREAPQLAPWVAVESRAAAVFLREESWGAMSYATDLVVYELGEANAAREVVRVRVLGEGDEIDSESGAVRSKHRAAVQQRLATVHDWLTDLGFAPDPTTKLVPLDLGTGRTRLPGTDLTVVVDERETRVKQRGRLLGRSPGLTGFTHGSAVHLAAVQAVAVISQNIQPEGCYVEHFVFASLISIAHEAAAPSR